MYPSAPSPTSLQRHRAAISRAARSTSLLFPLFWLLPYVALQNLAHPLPRNTEPCLKLRQGKSRRAEATDFANLLPSELGTVLVARHPHDVTREQFVHALPEQSSYHNGYGTLPPDDLALFCEGRRRRCEPVAKLCDASVFNSIMEFSALAEITAPSPTRTRLEHT